MKLPTNTPILIIDPDENSRQMMVNILRYEDFRVIEWRDSGSVEEISTTNCGMVVIDINLPSADGLEIISKLRGSELTRRISIVICTKLNSDDDMIRGLDAGADDYIIKPYSPQLLVARLRSIMRRRNLKSHIG